MLEKRTLFNTTVVSEEEFEAFQNRGFFTDNNFTTTKFIYRILFIILSITFLVSLTLFYQLRNSYIIHQRGFTLSFIGGIITYIYVICGFLPVLTKVPCTLIVYSINVLNVLVYLTFFTRSLRILLSYRYNIYKVTRYKKRRRVVNSNESEEPNSYFTKIYKKINVIIAAVIIIPTLISFLITLSIHIRMKNGECRFFDVEDTLLGLKQNKGKNLFRLVRIFGRFYMFISIFTFISLFFVKDSNVLGAKFECLTTSLLIFIFAVINGILMVTITTDGDVGSSNHRRVFLDFFEATNGGKILFTIVSSYILFISITLPVIQYYIAKRAKTRSSNEVSLSLRPLYDKFNSKEAFKEVLKTPTFVHQLRDIAIKEFSVENVLFWENYKILQNMNHRYFVETKKAEELGNMKLVDLYDFEGYYQEQIQYYNTTVMDNYSYNSNLPVPAAIIPYYDRFYKTFIYANCPAKVNISHKIEKAIESEIARPTVGIFDVAKDEVIDMMYNSIYPTFLKKNKKQLEETFSLNK